MNDDFEIHLYEGAAALRELGERLASTGFPSPPLATMDPDFLAQGFEEGRAGAVTAWRGARPIAYMTYTIRRMYFRPSFGPLSLSGLPCRQLMLYGYAGREGDPPRIIERFFRQLKQVRAWDIAGIFDLPVDNPLGAYIVEHPTYNVGYRAVNSVFDTCQVAIGEGFETYLKTHFTKKTRYNLRREVRLLEEAAGGEVTVKVHLSPDEVVEFLHAAESIARRSRKWRGTPGPLAPTPPLIRKLTCLAGQSRWRGYVLYIGNAPAAFCHATLHWSALFVELVGHAREFTNLNPGKVLLYNILQELHDSRAVRQLDMGIATPEYRRIFATSHRPAVDSTLYRCRPYPQMLRLLAHGADGGYRLLRALIGRWKPVVKRLVRQSWIMVSEFSELTPWLANL